MKQLTHKGYGRIYCEHVNDIDSVKKIIKEIDDFEYEYLPKDLITTYDKYPQTVYIGKFSDMDMNKLTAECWKRGVKIWVFDDGHNEF